VKYYLIWILKQLAYVYTVSNFAQSSKVGEPGPPSALFCITSLGDLSSVRVYFGVRWKKLIRLPSGKSFAI